MGWVAILTVLFLAPNTYYVYYSFSVFATPYREIAGVGVSLIIAGSILIYTLRKNFKVAKYYSLFEVSISAYYYINTIGLDWGLIPALVFTLILPISVYYYSKEFDKDSGNESIENYIAHSEEQIKKLIENIDTLKDQLQTESENLESQCGYNSDLLQKLSEAQSEVSHWTSEYERAVQGWTNDVSLRDERISELEALNIDTINQRNDLAERVSYLDGVIEERDKELKTVIDNRDSKVSHLERQLSEYYDDNKKLEKIIDAKNQTIEAIKSELNTWRENGTTPTREPYSKTVSTPSITAISTAPASDAFPEPKSDTKPAKSQAPKAKTRVK